MKNYVYDKNTFHFIKTINCKPNSYISVLINPNNINMSFYFLDFAPSKNNNECYFCEDTKVVGKLLDKIEPIAHNRSHDKSVATFEIFDASSINYSKQLFDWNQYSKFSHLSYDEAGWDLNKNKLYAFIYFNYGVSTWDSELTVLWNEFS